MNLQPCFASLLLCVAGTCAGNSSEPEPFEEGLMRSYGIKINVDDMEKALLFYVGNLGFEVEGT